MVGSRTSLLALLLKDESRLTHSYAVTDMNECLKLVDGKVELNVRSWVTPRVRSRSTTRDQPSSLGRCWRCSSVIVGIEDPLSKAGQHGDRITPLAVAILSSLTLAAPTLPREDAAGGGGSNSSHAVWHVASRSVSLVPSLIWQRQTVALASLPTHHNLRAIRSALTWGNG